MLRTNAARDVHLHRFDGALIIPARCWTHDRPMLIKRVVCNRPNCTFTLSLTWRPCSG